MDSDDVVRVLPVKHRPGNGLMLVPPAPGCIHFPASFTIDLKGGKCFCKKCGAEVAPMYVLEQLMHHESQWQQTRTAYQDEMKRLKERRSTKCQHCRKMTRISKL